jgi:peptide/nickel transport system substrate-binding protein
MRARILLAVALGAAVAVLAAACGGGSSSGGGTTSAPPADTSTGETSAPTTGADTGGQPTKGGILRIGTSDYIDSLNPYNYIEAQATNAMNMIYPQLVQYDYGENGYEIVGDWAESWETSADGKDWTFHLQPGGTWSDGQPLTVEDAVWTINTTVEYADGPTGEMAPSVSHVVGADAPDENTLVIHYEAPVGNALAQLQQLWILPKHVWEPLVGSDGKGLKTYHPEQNLPMVTGGAYDVKQWEKKGTTVFVPNPGFYGPASNAEAVALTYYTNSDSMIADLKGEQLDWIDQIPFEAVDVLKSDPDIVVNAVPGAEITNITWNSNPRKPKNRELLDPRVKKALSMCVDRQRIIDVVFKGYADLNESLVGNISPLVNPNLGPLEYDCDAANQMLDELGYARGPDGTRVAPATTGEFAQPAHKMEYEIVTPEPGSINFNINRSFQIVQEGFATLGVKVTQKVGGDASATYAIETGNDCDAKTSKGYTGWDIAMWDWVPYVDPDFQLSVVTKSQWCSWSDTGYDNPEYDKLYHEQGLAVDPEKRREIVYRMQQIVYDDFVYTQLVNEQFLDAHTKAWNIPPELTNLNAYSKTYYTAPYKVE